MGYNLIGYLHRMASLTYPDPSAMGLNVPANSAASCPSNFSIRLVRLRRAAHKDFSRSLETARLPASPCSRCSPT